MIVNDLVKTIGYTRNKLDHFEFCIWNPVMDDWITLRKVNADQYVHICDREILDWMINEVNEDMISVNVRMVDSDYETFRDYIKE